MSKYKYDQRGVSATKDEVHAAIKGLDKGLYPNAFCKILPDVAGGDEAYVNLMHADTAGTKTSLAYLYWKETGDVSVWKGIAQDALVMNIDDMACVGCVDNIILSSTIGRNKNLITGEVIATLIQSAVSLAKQLKEHGVHLHLAGGETADVGDIVRTIDVGYTAFARMKKSDLLVNNIQPGNVIVGFASYGQATYEDTYNGGMGSNGLTSARHDVLSKEYAKKYPDSYDSNTPDEVVYLGSRKLTDKVVINGQELTIGKLLLSPTRTYLPVIKTLFDRCRKGITGMIHCTGGAQTKVLKFVDGVHVIKDNLLPIPPLFRIIKEESGTDWKELYQVLNMGHRLEVYLEPAYAKEVLKIAKKYKIEAKIIGKVTASNKNKVSILAPDGKWLAYTDQQKTT